MSGSPPHQSQDHAQVAKLIKTLEEAAEIKSKSAPFVVSRRSFDLATGQTINRWKFREFDYVKPNLPVYARGLFTYKTRDGKHEIAARGYDKFFNLGESEVNGWAAIGRRSRGPYELSVKENGCIIFMSGLDDGTLLVCSKNSTGTGSNAEMSHSTWGERWIDRHLAASGKSRDALARALRRANATAVAELCDDEFEEHVLPYQTDRAGLYLHGLNLNLPQFATYPGPMVDKFADEWGFKKVDYVIKDNIEQVEKFLTEAAETGTFDGRDTEGFVVRCQAQVRGAAEYSDYFFKFKFEEPYLLYRQWRELTKSAIHGKVPKIQTHKQFTRQYLEYAMHRLDRDPKLREAYLHNHGVIEIRQQFLHAHQLTGMDVVRHEQGDVPGDTNMADLPPTTPKPLASKVVIVPVATIGCGKTTVALALTRLFGWGHVQNDNVTAQKNKFGALSNLARASLAEKPVVIVDRNNHQRRERRQIFDMLPPYPGAYSFICLHYVHPADEKAEIYAATRARIFDRGDNHQTIHANSNGRLVESIMGGFLNRFEPVETSNPADADFSLVVDLDPRVSSRKNLETTIAQMHSAYPELIPDGIPSGADMDAAVEWALEYQPDVKHSIARSGKEPRRAADSQTDGSQQKQQPAQPGTSAKVQKLPMEYFSVHVKTSEVRAILHRVFESPSNKPVRGVYDELDRRNRIQSHFHVTLIHRSASTVAENASVWTELLDLYRPFWIQAMGTEGGSQASLGEDGPELGTARVKVDSIVWNHRLMCLVVRILPDNTTAETSDTTKAGTPSVRFRSVNRVAHITIGTMASDIKPKESNDLLARWLDETPEPGNSKRWEVTLGSDVVLDGSVRGVLQRFRR